MKIKSAFASICIMLVLLNSTNAQLVIDEKSDFWMSHLSYRYRFTITNPEEYSLRTESSWAASDGIVGNKIYKISDELIGEFSCDVNDSGNDEREIKKESLAKIGEIYVSTTMIDQSIIDPTLPEGRGEILFYIDTLLIISFSGYFTLTKESSEAQNERYWSGSGIEGEDILFNETKKKAFKEFKDFVLKNFKIEKIGDLSPEESTATSQTDASGQFVDGNLDTATWVKVVGGAAALAGAMALVAKIFRARRKKSSGKPNQPEPKKANKQQKENKKKEEDEEDEKFFYILQLNKDVLEIGPEKNDKLVVTAWRVDSAGNRSLAKDAAIQVLTSERSIAISSPSGKGQCASDITFQSAGRLNDAILNISAAVGGKTLKASAKVTCNQQLTLIIDAPTPLTFINGKKYQEALFEQQRGETDGEWIFKPFCLWFTDDPNPTIDPDRTKPVKPPFNPIFKIEAMPDVLEISTPVHHGENVWKADVKLFAEKSVDTNWLFNDGKIKITVTVDEQKLNVK